MPELPEVETVKRGIENRLLNQTVQAVDIRRPNIRFTIPPQLSHTVNGATLMHVERRSKYLLLHFSNHFVVLIHLGMSGQIIITPKTEAFPPQKHDHVVFTFDDFIMTYRDPRRFGIIDLLHEDQKTTHALLKDIGPEPFSNHFHHDYFYAAIKTRKSPIKTLLLNQNIVAGIGNIYASEALFRAGISPLRLGHKITKAEALRLLVCIQETLQDAINAGGSTLKDYIQTDGQLGYFQHSFKVYGRAGEACPDCTCSLTKTGGIQKITQSGRSTFYCASKQK